MSRKLCRQAVYMEILALAASAFRLPSEMFQFIERLQQLKDDEGAEAFHIHPFLDFDMLIKFLQEGERGLAAGLILEGSRVAQNSYLADGTHHDDEWPAEPSTLVIEDDADKTPNILHLPAPSSAAEESDASTDLDDLMLVLDDSNDDPTETPSGSDQDSDSGAFESTLPGFESEPTEGACDATKPPKHDLDVTALTPEQSGINLGPTDAGLDLRSLDAVSPHTSTGATPLDPVIFGTAGGTDSAQSEVDRLLRTCSDVGSAETGPESATPGGEGCGE